MKSGAYYDPRQDDIFIIQDPWVELGVSITITTIPIRIMLKDLAGSIRKRLIFLGEL